METGFDNSGYFCKVFRKAYGVSPLRYRKAKQKAPDPMEGENAR